MFFDIFSALCAKKEVSASKAASQIGLSNSTVTKWKKTGATPDGATLAKIAAYFGVNIDFLLGMTDESYLMATEYQLSLAKKQYAKEKDEEKRDALASQIDVLRESVEDQRLAIRLSQTKKMLSPPEIAEEVVTFPVIGGVAAGYDHICYEDWTGDSIEIPRSYLHGREPKDYFVLKVMGQSMYPDYQDGDHVLVLRQPTMDRSGQIGVVVYGDENATLKRIEYIEGHDWMTLRPVNPQFPPITVRGEALEHCTVLGVAKLVIREVAP